MCVACEGNVSEKHMSQQAVKTGTIGIRKLLKSSQSNVSNTTAVMFDMTTKSDSIRASNSCLMLDYMCAL